MLKEPLNLVQTAPIEEMTMDTIVVMTVEVIVAEIAGAVIIAVREGKVL
jgi:hypothetical protein